MKIRYSRVNDLADSYLNGNKSFVKREVKKLNKAEFCLLASQLADRLDNMDVEEIVYKLTLY